MPVYPNGAIVAPAVSRGGEYGAPRSAGRIHAGSDFIGYENLIATHNGLVTQAGWMNNAAGNAIAYDLDFKGPYGETITIVRMHCQRIDVALRSRIKEGQHIGLKGFTGNAVGECDHLEVRFWKNGTYRTVNPVSWLAGEVNGTPPWPLPVNYYFGPKEGPINSVSGYHSHREDLRTWQAKMKQRGWSIIVDGLYGNNTKEITHKFQTEKHLVSDGLIGPATWRTAWTSPVT